mgnify:CR=1 FL=1
MIYSKKEHPYYHEFVMFGEGRTIEGRRYGMNNAKNINDDIKEINRIKTFRYEVGGNKNIHMLYEQN